MYENVYVDENAYGNGFEYGNGSVYVNVDVYGNGYVNAQRETRNATLVTGHW